MRESASSSPITKRPSRSDRVLDAVVVGGGPAGSRAAALLARDHDVTVIEEHRVSGKPMQCTGLLTSETIGLSSIRPRVISPIYGTKVIFPSGGVIELRSKKPMASVVDRADLDSRLADEAMSAGAVYSYGDRYVNHTSISKGLVIESSTGVREARLLIGADGSKSKLSASIPDNAPKEMIRGIQADVRGSIDESDVMRLRVGSKTAPGFFSWEIPCGDFTRVGLCTSWSAGPPSDYLNALLKKGGYQDREIIEKHSGMIPVGGVRRTYSDRLMLIGDAACQVKPISGGGLFPIFKCAAHLAFTADRALKEDDLSEKNLSQYQRLWKQDIGSSLSKGYRIRKAYVKMSDEKLDYMCDVLDRPDVKKILSDIDLDDPVALMPKIMSKPTVMLRLMPMLLRSII